MPSRCTWIVCLGILVSFWMNPAINAQETPLETDGQSVPHKPAEYESRQVLGKGVTKAQLTNGLTVLVQENHAAPVATARCYVFNTGSAYEGDYLGAGISHLLEHLVAGGSTTKRTEEEITALVDTLGGQTNAYTSSHVTAYYIDCPSKGINLAIELVADNVQHSTIPQNEYARELGVVQRELEMGESDRSRVRYKAMKQLIYTKHPMRHPTIGYLPVLQRISREDVLDFYHSRYVPQNMCFVVTGDVDTDKVLEQVKKRFSNFQRTTERGPILAAEPDQASPRSVRIEMQGETSILSVAWPTVPLQHPDLYPLDVASYLLTHGDSSRLVRRLKINQPLAISVSSASYTPGFVKGWFEISVECGPENTDQCLKIIMEEIDRLKTEPAEAAELAKVKRQKAAEHVFGQQTVQAQAEALGRSFHATGDPLFDDHYVEGIQRVTAEQIQEVMEKYFRPQRLNTVILDPPGVRSSVEKESVADVESDIKKIVLPNGLTVLLKRQAVLPMVSMQAFVKAGVLSDSDDKSGRAALATKLMEKGTEKYSAEQIAEYFDSIGGSLSTGSQRNTSYLQATTLKDDFETALDYVHQVLYHPTFPEDEFLKAQQLQLGQIAARQGNPQTEILDYWTRNLPDSSPYSRTILGSEETVQALTLGDCREFHHKYFVPNNMVLAVFGDIDVEETEELLKRKFGAEPKREEFSFPEFTRASNDFSAEADLTKHLKNEAPPTSAMVVMGYATTDIYHKKNEATLKVLNTILTRGFSSRLFRELRGQRLVYYCFGFEMTGLAPGYFLFMAQTQPETAPEVIKRIEANLQQIAAEGIPEEELANAKEKMIAAHAMSNTTAGSQAFQAALNELYGLGYDFDKTYEDRVNAVSSEDIQKIVQKYFNKSLTVTSASVPIGTENTAAGEAKSSE